MHQTVVVLQISAWKKNLHFHFGGLHETMGINFILYSWYQLLIIIHISVQNGTREYLAFKMEVNKQNTYISIMLREKTELLFFFLFFCFMKPMNHSDVIWIHPWYKSLTFTWTKAKDGTHALPEAKISFDTLVSLLYLALIFEACPHKLLFPMYGEITNKTRLITILV